MHPAPSDDKLDTIIYHLQRMDRRDRLRTWAGFVRSLIGILPILVFLFATWYSIQHLDEIIQKVTSEAAKQAAALTTNIELPQGMSMEQLQKLLLKK